MLESEVEEYKKLTKELKKLNPEAHCTLVHGAGLHQDYYNVHEWGKPISGDFSNILDALNDGITKLKKQQVISVF